MAIKRIAECDICETLGVEKNPNSGWDGWCIIQGIAMEDPKDEPLTEKNTQTMLCCDCKEKVSSFLDAMKLEVG